jgi:hypothetical protein
VEGADGAGADFSIVPKDCSVDIACNQPHPASLRGRPAAGVRRVEHGPGVTLGPGASQPAVRGRRRAGPCA